MQDHWAEFGLPVHISVAAFMGHKSKRKPRKAMAREPVFDDFEADMAAMFPEGWG